MNKNNWKPNELIIEKPKNNKTHIVNNLSNSIATRVQLKKVIRENNLGIKKEVKINKIDNYKNKYSMICITTRNFHKLIKIKYKLYSKTFDIRHLEYVKKLINIYNKINT